MPTGTWLNATIGAYRLIEFVGAGGMGEVYRAIDLRDSRQVAVKVLTAAKDSSSLRARFRNEAQIHAGLEHPNIARMLEYLEHEGTPAIAMEYVDGETLEERILRTGPMPLDQAIRGAMALVGAVAYLHRRNIVHRDIKSTNVKITSTGRITLLDFGIAKGPDSPALTADGSVIGTLQSLAPEQLAGAPADLQTEIWALGVLLYEMVAGRHPFADHGVNDITARIRAARYTPPSHTRRELPSAVDQVVGHCLRVNPRQRYPSCEAMLTDLRRLTDRAPAVDRTGTAPAAWRQRLPLIGSLGATVVAVGFLVSQLRPPVDPTDPPAQPVPAIAPVTPPASPPTSPQVPAASDPAVRPATNVQVRTITISTLNGTAEVWRDGAVVGSTPYRIPATLGQQVELVLRRDGYRDQSVDFTVTEGRSEYNYVLRAIDRGRPMSSLPDPLPLLLLGAWFSLPWGRRREARQVAANVTVDRPAFRDGEGLNAESRVVIGSATDPGCVRDNNEDTVRVVRPNDSANDGAGLLALVCDGMGGHAAGETASRIAAEVIGREYPGGDDPGGALARAVERANRAVYDAAHADKTLEGMGTTVTALVLRGGLAWCAHVGDSRCYLVRDGEIFLMTEDHSAVMAMVREGTLARDQVRHHPDKNVISRALGSHRDIEVATWPRPFVVRPGDRFLLCSDGLHDVLDEPDILRVVSEHAPHVACSRLVALTRDSGAPDNVSVVMLALPTPEARDLRTTRPGVPVP